MIWIGEIENYGADSEVGEYLINHDGACDYGDIADAAEIAAYEVFGKDNIDRNTENKHNALPNNSGEKCKGRSRKSDFRK